jgi:nucleotide-binding universal stress UspA family protein
MYDRIIVPIEEGASAEALEEARALARTLGCCLTLLYVHHVQEAPAELEGLTQYRYQGVVESWDERDLVAEARELEWLGKLAESVAEGESDLEISARVVHAPLTRRLPTGDETVLVLASADDVHIDGLSRTLRALLRGGGVPILLFKPGMRTLPVHRILVTLDGSHFSEEVLGPVLDLARAVRARLSLLEVVTRSGGMTRLLRPTERSAEAAERFLRDVRTRIPEDLGPVDVRVMEKGNPAAGIIAESNREDIDLVAMATHGRGGLRRLILGSVAEAVVRNSQVPVLLYRPVGAATRSPATAEPRASSI